MKPPARSLTLTLTFAVAGAALGWFVAGLGGVSSSAPVPLPAVAPAATAPAVSIDAVEKRTPDGYRALLRHPAFGHGDVWTVWAKGDPAACFEEFRKQPLWQNPMHGPRLSLRLDEEGRLLPTQFLESLFQTWLEKDTVAAAAAVETLPAHLLVREMRILVMRSLLAKNPLEAIACIRRNSSPGDSILSSGARWSLADRQALAVEVAQLPGNQIGDTLTEEFAKDYAQENPVAALAWVEKLTRRNRVRVMQEVMRRLVTLPPAQCLAAVSGLPKGSFRHAAAQVAAEWLGRKSGAEAWAAAEAAGLLEETMPKLFNEWAGSDPRAAFDFAVKQPPQWKDRIIADAVFLLNNRYPALAGPEAAKLPPGHARTRVLLRIIPDWVKVDVEGAATWLETAGTGPDVMQFAALLYQKWAETNPDRAVVKAQTLPASLREPAVISLYQQWARRDSSAAAASAASLKDESLRTAAQWALTRSR